MYANLATQGDLKSLDCGFESHHPYQMKYYTDGKRHLVCKPYSIDNLHAMAKKLGIGKHWFHKNHYDIPKKRIDEIEKVCIMVSSKEIVKIIADVR